MAPQEEPFVSLLNRTIRRRWSLMAQVVIACFVLFMVIIALLPPNYMAVGMVRIGYVGPGYGGLSLNTIAIEAGSTGFIERVKKEVGVESGKMVARVRFQSNLIELRAYAESPEQAKAMVRTAGRWTVEKHEEIMGEVFAGAKALYLERFGKEPQTEELIFKRTTVAFEEMEEIKSVKPGWLTTAFLSLFLGFFLGLALIVYRELMEQNAAA